MLDHRQLAWGQETERNPTPSPIKRRSKGNLLAARTAAFTGCLALILVYALRGGSYDTVVFQEHGLVVWWVIAIGVAVGLLPRSRPPRAALIVLGALLAYAIWTAFSLIWSQSSERTTQELARVLGYAGVVTLLGAALNRNTWRAGAAGLGVGTLLVCLLAVGTRLAPSVFPTDFIDTRFHIDRLSYPFGYWNAVGAWAAMATAIGLAWSAHDDVRWRRALALGLVPVAGLTTYLTYSRAGIGGTAAAVIAVLALSRNRLTASLHVAVAAAGTVLVIAAARGAPAISHATGTSGAGGVAGALALAVAACAAVALLTGGFKVDRRRVPRPVFRWAGAVCLIVALAAAVALGPGLVRRGWHSFTHTAITASTDPTARLGTLSSSRYPLWKVTLNGFDAHPLDGTGAGTFEFWWNRHATNGEFVRDAHSIWLQNMAELGLPGLLLIVAVAVSAIVAAATGRWRARRDVSAGVTTAFLAAFIVFLLHASVDWMWQSTAVTVLALAGVAAVSARGAARRLRLRWPMRTAVVTFALLAGLVQLPGLIRTTTIRASQSAERSGDPNAALAWARDAVSAEPWSASAYEQRGLVLESAKQYAAAAQDLQRAVEHEPTNYTHWLVLARIEAEQGKLSSAARDLRRSRALRPRAQVFALAPYFRGAPPPAPGATQGP